MTSAQIQQFVYDFLHDKGLPHKSIVSIMGNITGESSWDVNAIEGGTGIGRGLCQWSYGRRTQLEAYGVDLTHQCNFLWSELTGENRTATGAENQWINPPANSVTGGNGFTCSIATFRAGTSTIDFLTSAWCYCWERPAPSTNHLSSTRIPSANTFNTSMTYKGGGVVDPPPVDPPVDPTPTGDAIGDVYPKIQASAYNTKQLSAEQITFLIKLATIGFVQPIPDLIVVPVDPPTYHVVQPTATPVIREVKMSFTFNHNKRQIGQNYTSKRLTFDDKTYKIKDVRSDGFIILVYGGSLCYNYINPIYIKSNT
jgi:hypothetical protein